MLVCNCVGDVYKVIKVVYDVMKVKIMVDKQVVVFYFLDCLLVMIQFNLDGIIKEVNENFFKVMGY